MSSSSTSSPSISVYAEPIDNHPRCPCVLVLDTSGSMRDKPIAELNQGLVTFQRELVDDELAKKRVEVAIVTFDSQAKCVQDFTRANRFQAPTLGVKGHTVMGAGLSLALQTLKKREAALRTNEQAYYRPWMFLITDGRPEGEPSDAMDQVVAEIVSLVKQERLLFHAIGVQGADMALLQRIAPGCAHKLKELAFSDLFKFISASIVGYVSRPPSVHVPPVLVHDENDSDAPWESSQ